MLPCVKGFACLAFVILHIAVRWWAAGALTHRYVAPPLTNLKLVALHMCDQNYQALCLMAQQCVDLKILKGIRGRECHLAACINVHYALEREQEDLLQ